MKVLVAEKCGFCPGVKSAIQIAHETLADNETVYCLGEIIHNADIVSELAGEGLQTVESVEQIESGTVLIRSHGATTEQLEKIRKKNLKMVDATCVLVKKVQKIAKNLSEDGYKVVMIGDKNHPEVKAVVGFATDITVIAGEEDLHKLPSTGKGTVDSYSAAPTLPAPTKFSTRVTVRRESTRARFSKGG